VKDRAIIQKNRRNRTPKQEGAMEKVNYMEIAEKTMAQIKKGAFLTVRAGDELNTMTIGWATIGFCWKKPVLMVAVRDSRHTFGLMERAGDFTVSVPSENVTDDIMFCGTKSGRDVNKFDACSITPLDAQAVSSPIIDIKGIHMECKIVVKTRMSPELMTQDYDSLYPEKDYHTLYFGEIQACYER
jgi:flavin reductase (DIM6/NTAB) family NADH-FMN oxidoreductase RutF